MNNYNFHEVVDLHELALNSAQKVCHDKLVLHRSVSRNFVDELAVRNIHPNNTLSRFKRWTSRKYVLNAI